MAKKWGFDSWARFSEFLGENAWQRRAKAHGNQVASVSLTVIDVRCNALFCDRGGPA
jgi:hypothetical protein